MTIRLGVNFLVFTLNEKVTLTNPGFILILKNDSTEKQVACKLGTELSEYTDRFNRFLVTVKTSPTALNSEVNLDDYGWHSYFIYESESPNSFDYAGVDDIDLSTLTGLVERGKIKYLKVVEEIPTYTTRPTSIKAYVS